MNTSFLARFLFGNGSSKSLFAILLLSLLLTHELSAQGPTVGYAYPAGGQKGTTFRVIIGGKQLLQAEEAIISGEGVSAKILRRFRNFAMNNYEVALPAKMLYQEEAEILYAPADEQAALRKEMLKKRQERLNKPDKTDEEKAYFTPEQLIEAFPYFDEMLNRNQPEDIQRVAWEYFLERPDRKPKETISQGLLLEVTIAPNASCGNRQLILRGPKFQTQPILFQIGDIPEIEELEPNDTPEIPVRWNNQKKKSLPIAWVQLPPAKLPVLFNGRIRPGDTDLFQFEAQKGQKLLIHSVGRFLNPFLADAVPGWFQPVLRLYGPNGNELAWACCWKNDPDPILIFEVPENGLYRIEIRDSLFRGRDDFVYRLAVGELPMINSIYPPSIQAGTPQDLQITGINLPASKINSPTLNPAPNWDGVPVVQIQEIDGKPLLRPATVTVEAETPQEAADSQNITLPSVFYGKLSHRGQNSDFYFSGKKGEKVTVDVTASALDSPLDSRLEIRNADGKVLAENDDRAGADGPNIGLRTHHSDPRILFTIPEDGTYCARISNTLYEENQDNIYRIRFSRPEPDFLAFAEGTDIRFANASVPLKVKIIRLGGFEGPVEIFSKSPEFIVSNGLIPKGKDQTYATLMVKGTGWPEELRNSDPKLGLTFWNLPLPLVVRSVNASSEESENENLPQIERPIWGTQKREQAFIYFHQIPIAPLTATFTGRRQNPFIYFGSQPAEINREGETELCFQIDYAKNPDKLQPWRWRYPSRWFTLAPECEGFEISSQHYFGNVCKFKIRVTDPEKAANVNALLFEHCWWRPKLENEELLKEQFDEPQPFDPPIGKLPTPTGVLPAVMIKLK